MVSPLTNGDSAPRERRQIILFGGHGSPSLFSSAASQRAQDDAEKSAAGAIFLARCHAAFLEECLGLDDLSRRKLCLDSTEFQSLRQFLVPLESFRKNPIVQATTLCLYQLLRYIAEVENPDQQLEPSGSRVLEVVGVCSGLLPAAVVATTKAMPEVIDIGVQAFRLAFWIAYRTAIHGCNFGTEMENTGSWTIVLNGLNQRQAEEKVNSFCDHIQRRLIRLSAVLSANAVSVTGPSNDLHLFHDWLGPKVTVKSATVNAWYHGGDQLESIAEQVMQDVESRQLKFPDLGVLLRPLRSAYNGSFANQQEPSKNGLARWIVWHMLVHPFDWLKTSENIIETVAPIIASQESFRPRFLSFGPSSEWLVGGFRSHALHPKFDVTDLSAFHATQTADLPTSHEGDIAIVGMGVNFPRGHGQEELWNALFRGTIAVSEIPKSRFDASYYHDDDGSEKSRKMAARHGAFVDDIWKFDNAFFRMTPREAMSMDPQQRILLHTTQAALNDAGYIPDSTPTFQRTSMGCYIGVATGDYTDNLRDGIDAFYSTGTLRAFLSGRISFVHNLSGPSIVTDTACSSSLASIYQACRALNNGDCTAAIAGGVNTISSPDMYLGLDHGHFLSPTGGCRPFDASADGYCRAEGCGVFILKRYADAIQENDQIYGLIKGVEANQSGNAHSITHPHSETQTQLFERLFSKAKVEPGTISVVEAHGTGTQAGDAREIASLQSVFGDCHSADCPLVVSSIKGNIGHAEAASGAAGLAKVLLMIRHKIIPAQASLKQLNPRFVGLEDAGIVIPLANREWQHPRTQPRRAMLNNFGAAGSNVALLLEEHVAFKNKKSGALDRSSYVFNVSAKSAAAHQAYVQRYQDYLGDLKSKPLIKDICYTATARRENYSYRSSVSCNSIEDLRAKLNHVDTVSFEPSQAPKTVVFAFSGQGSIYRGMSEGLMDSSSFFKNEIFKCDKIVQGLGFPSFLPYLTKQSEDRGSLIASEEIVTSQCACVALEYSVAKLFLSWNVIPSYVVGHSLGEYAALAVAGALSLEDTFRVVAWRAQIMFDECRANESGMIACKVSASTVEQILAFETVTPELAVACENSFNDCVVSGPLSQIHHFEQICKMKPIKAKRLDVPYGYHSASMEPIVKRLKELGRSVTWCNPAIPVASAVHGRLFQKRDQRKDYFAEHARQPVRFSTAIESIDAAGGFSNSICIEIGPHPTVSSLIKSIPGSSHCPCYPALKKDVDAWSTLNTILCQISLARDDIRWREVFTDCQSATISLPSYPLEGSYYEAPFRELSSEDRNDPTPSYRETGFTLLPRIDLTQSSSDSFIFETTSMILGNLISGHNVGGTGICPASVYHELTVEAAQIAKIPAKGQVWRVCNMSFQHPLVHNPSNPGDTIALHLNKIKNSDSFELKISSTKAEDQQKTSHFTSTVTLLDPATTRSRRMKEAAMVKRQASYFATTSSHSTFRTRVLYEKIFTRVVSYAKEYHTLEELHVSSSTLEGYGTLTLPSGSLTEKYVVPPAFTDTLLHTAGFIANLRVESEEVCICSHVESVEILYGNLDFRETFTIYCSLFDDAQGSVLAEAYVLDTAGQAVALCSGMEFKKLRLKTFQKAIQPAIRITTSTVEATENLQGIETMVASPDEPGTPKTPDDSYQEVKRTIIHIMSESCGFTEENLTQASSLSALGIDSLMQIEIASALKSAFPGSNIDQDMITACDTIQSLEDSICSQNFPGTPQSGGHATGQPAGDHEPFLNGHSNGNPTDLQDTRVNGYKTRTPSDGTYDANRSSSGALSSTEAASANPFLLKPSKDKKATPLFLFHDGSGQGSLYGRIGDISRGLFAFSDPDYATDRLRPLTLTQMARRYVDAVAKTTTRSLILGGWSFGGVLAFEAAHLLQARGFDIKGLILIDSPYPRNHQPLPEAIIKHILRKSVRSKSAIMNSDVSDIRYNHLLTEFKSNAALLGTYTPSASQKYIKTVMLRSRDTFDTEALCGLRYDWLSDQNARTKAIKGWERLIGGTVDVLEIPGNHFEAFDQQNIAETRTQLQKACRIIEDLSK